MYGDLHEGDEEDGEQDEDDERALDGSPLVHGARQIARFWCEPDKQGGKAPLGGPGCRAAARLAHALPAVIP